MNIYHIELLDTKEHVLFSSLILAINIKEALELAKEKAYHQIDKHNIVIRYISVQDGKEQYMYNMLTKKTEKWY